MLQRNDTYEDMFKSLRRMDPDEFLPSDILFRVSQTPQEDMARHLRHSEELKEILRVCQDAGFCGETSLVEFIKDNIPHPLDRAGKLSQ
jgi:predicted nucleotidyltransferase